MYNVCCMYIYNIISITTATAEKRRLMCTTVSDRSLEIILYAEGVKRKLNLI